MQHKSLVSALAKAGATIVADGQRQNHFVATKQGTTIEWYTQDGYDAKSGEFTPEKPSVAVCFTRSPHTDLMRDYDGSTYYRTITEAVGPSANPRRPRAGHHHPQGTKPRSQQ